MHWSLNKRDEFIFSLIGLCISLAIAGGLIWLAPKITQQKLVEIDGEKFPLIYSHVGLQFRVWHEADSDWPWKDEFPLDAEGVSGTWAGVPFPVVHRRIEYPLYVAQAGLIRLHPAYWSPSEYHSDLRLYRPHWLGLLADTLFWGGLAWLTRWLWRTIIAHKRLRRGCCAHCNYDQTGLQPSERCPECGK